MQSIKAASYFVHFEENGYSEINKIINKEQYSTIFILVDENTMEYCYTKFMTKIATEKQIEVIEIEAGEIHKNIDTCVGVWQAMTALKADRKSLLITLGGGVITDLGGFVAATFKRGIDFVNVPTTLLSMVDASVGGKTGVDLGTLKNQIGLFVNPEMVLVDASFLTTVSEREIKSGMAEIIKYGVTYDLKLFKEIKDNNHLKNSDLIHRSIAIKNEVVLKDPKENSLRKILNFGHTIGHAIESFYLESSDKENLTHGEAIAIGMVCEAYLSGQLLDFPSEKLLELKKVILSIYDKIVLKESDFPAIIELLKHDKKNVNGQVNFVLLNDYEDFVLDCKAPTDLIIKSLQFYNS